ncbi:MFS transporter [Glutamicibacter sp. HZAU]|uniref:MFS transporter n=1 Tax=Glutamicibacter sp. HZAU TaxID=2049891 RepID=UPI000FFC652B|nr:MFS transporter [Glutamicibacter sp. HZAU]MDV2978619.1 MFS transporter [Actinomycetes bacterium ARC8]RWZ84747.1 MFS transporter [Glutamicibacter sp. HZAU]
MKSYWQILRQPQISLLLLIGMIARLPHSALSMLLLLHLVNNLDQSWVSAGLVTAVMTLGIAIGAPWRGARVDVWGLRRAMIPSVIVETLVWCTVPHVPLVWVYPLAFIGGLFALPVFSVVRTALGIMTTGEQRRTAFALDATATELVFIVGPASAGIVATQVSSVIGLSVIGVTSTVAGLALMILNPPTRSDDPKAIASRANVHEERLGAEASFIAAAPMGVPEVEGELIAAGMKSARARIKQRGRNFKNRFNWVSASVLAVFIASAGAGMLLTGTEVAIVAELDASAQSHQLGLVFFFWCGASLIGGLIYGSMTRVISPLVLLLSMAVLTIPMYFAWDTWSLALLSALPGFLCAPTLSAASEWLTDLVAEKRRGEAMGWYGSAMTAGTALGSPITGIFVDNLGPAPAFIGISTMAALVVVIALIAQQIRRRVRRARRRRLETIA